MAGISVEQTRGARRPVNGEISSIPMIDLLVCCISFLLITAVWSHMARLHATANVPGKEAGEPPVADKSLHIAVHGGERFTVSWRQGRDVISSVEVPRAARENRRRRGSRT